MDYLFTTGHPSSFPLFSTKELSFPCYVVACIWLHDCRPWIAIFYWYQINSFMLKKKKKSSSLFVELFRSTFWWPLWDQRTAPHTHPPKVLGLTSKRVVSTIEFIVTHCFLTDPGVWRHIFLLDPMSHTFVFRALPILFEIILRICLPAEAIVLYSVFTVYLRHLTLWSDFEIRLFQRSESCKGFSQSN